MDSLTFIEQELLRDTLRQARHADWEGNVHPFAHALLEVGHMNGLDGFGIAGELAIDSPNGDKPDLSMFARASWEPALVLEIKNDERDFYHGVVQVQNRMQRGLFPHGVTICDTKTAFYQMDWRPNELANENSYPQGTLASEGNRVHNRRIPRMVISDGEYNNATQQEEIIRKLREISAEFKPHYDRHLMRISQFIDN